MSIAPTQSIEFNGERIKRIRIARGESQQEFATWLGVSISSVGNWETGDHLPTKAKVLQRLLAAERELGLA